MNDSGGGDCSGTLCGVRNYHAWGGGGEWTLGYTVKCPDVLVANATCLQNLLGKMTQMPKKSDLNLKARGLGTHEDTAF